MIWHIEFAVIPLIEAFIHRYTFFDHNLRKWGQPIGYDELSGFAKEVQDLPLVNEPGTKWQYGVSPVSKLNYGET